MTRRLAPVLLLALAACTRSTPNAAVSPTASPTTQAPSVSPTSSPAASGSIRVPVYYLGGTSRPVLYREFRSVPRTSAVVRAAVDAMLHLTPLDADYRSYWPTAATVRGVSLSGATATVDLSANARQVTTSTANEKQSLQQLVHTVTAAAPKVTSVRLLFDGATQPTLWGHVSTTDPISRAPQADTLAPVWVLEPALSVPVSRTFTVTGTASVFEATVSWSVTRGDATLAHGAVTASIGAPGRGDYTVRVTLPAGTTGDVVFTAWEESAEDGSVTFPDSKTYRVT